MAAEGGMEEKGERRRGDAASSALELLSRVQILASDWELAQMH